MILSFKNVFNVHQSNVVFVLMGFLSIMENVIFVIQNLIIAKNVNQHYVQFVRIDFSLRMEVVTNVELDLKSALYVILYCAILVLVVTFYKTTHALHVRVDSQVVKNAIH